MITIRNCHINAHCLQTWDALIEMADPQKRFCDVCQQVVQLCHSPKQLQDALLTNQCVAVQLELVAGTANQTHTASS